MIITICRTLNEERNIERFCREYSKISDQIIIADGGSEDRTLEIASSFEKAMIVEFHERVYRDSGVWRNPHGRHINFMITLAEHADWIIFDDCDSVPNAHLVQNFHDFISLGSSIIEVPRAYIYGDSQWFPKLSTGSCLWAWRPEEKIRASEVDPFKHHMHYVKSDRVTSLDFPYALLHYTWPDENEVQRKMKFYKEIREIPAMMHPTEMGGNLVPLPDWAIL